jgi:tetratricopeptide (TPR) repeat protein
VSRARARRDWRLAGLLLTAAAVLLGGLAIDRAGTPLPAAPPPRASSLPHQAEVQQLFDRAVLMLHARQYEPAATALHRVLQLAPALTEAHVNMGYAMLGLQRLKEARDFFDSATALRPDQANAYYGLALAWEAAGDLPMATGAMRSYLHLAKDERPEHLRRARAALWEWEQAQAARPARQ